MDLTCQPPEEIKKIVHEYGVLMAKDIPESNCLKNEVISSTENYIVPFMSQLSKDYCIVPKSKVKEEYNYYKDSWNETELTETTMESFETLFGKSLFEEGEK